MISLTKTLFTTVLTSAILIAIGLSPPLKAEDVMASDSPTTSREIYLTQRETNLVQEVDTVGITVSDMERAISFYSEALSFKKIADIEVYGEEYEQLLGLFGVRLRLVRMQLGDEVIELIQHLTTL